METGINPLQDAVKYAEAAMKMSGAINGFERHIDTFSVTVWGSAVVTDTPKTMYIRIKK